MESKICTKCKEVKYFDQFYKRYGSPREECKKCTYTVSTRTEAKQRVSLRNKERRKTDPKFRERIRLRYLKYRSKPEVRAKLNLIESKRREAIRLATPKWLTNEDINKINDIYLLCSYINSIAGKGKYCVDHIIPLRGKNICGLHISSNLQILDSKENFRKGNRYEKSSTTSLLL